VPVQLQDPAPLPYHRTTRTEIGSPPICLLSTHLCCCCPLCLQAASAFLFAFDPTDLRLGDIIQDERWVQETHRHNWTTPYVLLVHTMHPALQQQQETTHMTLTLTMHARTPVQVVLPGGSVLPPPGCGADRGLCGSSSRACGRVHTRSTLPHTNPACQPAWQQQQQ
jgi:hypothetical protein